jgi:hypothetical protein
MDVLANICIVRGFLVGRRDLFEATNRAIKGNKIKPVVTRRSSPSMRPKSKSLSNFGARPILTGGQNVPYVGTRNILGKSLSPLNRYRSSEILV